VERLAESSRRQALNDWLHGELLDRIEGRLLPLDTAVMLTWGTLIARLEKRGRLLPAIDSLVAATALHANLALVTRHVRDFEAADVRLVNPWQAT
jgi:tRNA(fMet)-specific endonuclease VapC